MSATRGDWRHNGAAEIIVLLADPHLDPLPSQGEAEAKAPVRVQFESIPQVKQFKNGTEDNKENEGLQPGKTFLTFVSFC
jgi:hypothetical protein